MDCKNNCKTIVSGVGKEICSKCLLGTIKNTEFKTFVLEGDAKDTTKVILEIEGNMKDLFKGCFGDEGVYDGKN